jgi:hypothetical protein
MNIAQRNRILSILLLIVIVGLGYWLYASITGPWQQVQKERQMTEQVRERMFQINNAIRFHNDRTGRFPESLDSLMAFLEADSLFQLRATNILVMNEFDPATFLNSPRTGNSFTYELNSESRPPLYILRDPDSEDHIGTLTRVTDRGAASWR